MNKHGFRIYQSIGIVVGSLELAIKTAGFNDELGAM